MDVTVKITVENFNLSNSIGGANVAGEGHVVYYLDEFPPTNQNQTAVTNGAVSLASLTYTWPKVSSGLHLFGVQLVNNDNTPLNPAVVDAVLFNVPAATSAESSQSFAAAITGPAITSITVSAAPSTGTPTMSPSPSMTMMPTPTGIMTPTATSTVVPTVTASPSP
jgi:hypothetical protein